MGQRIYWNRGDYEIEETLVEKRQLDREDRGTEEIVGREAGPRRPWYGGDRGTKKNVRQRRQWGMTRCD
jgi:hypothetical protein